MKKFGLFLVLMAGSATLALGGWWLYSEVIRPLIEPTPPSLEVLDQALARQDWETAREIFTKVSSRIDSLAQGRSLMIRALKFSQSSLQDWEPYLEVSQKIWETFPGSSQGAFFLSYGYLRSGKREEASRMLPTLEAFSTGTVDMDREGLKDLIREIRLRTELVYEGRESDLTFEGLTATLDNIQERLGLYRDLQSLVDDPGILQNTLLLYLKEGLYPEVLKLLNNDRIGLKTPLLKALIFYDSAQWERSLRVLKDLDSLDGDLQYNLLLADLTMHLSGAEAAALVYRRMVRESPESPLLPLHTSPIPYLNLATLLEEKGGDLPLKEASLLLNMVHEEGMEPLAKDLKDLSRLFKLELDYRLGGISAVSSQLLRTGLSPDEEILRYRLMPEYLSLPRLHFLFKNTEGPVFDRVTEALIWNLLLVQDYEKALDTIQKWEAVSEGESWWSSYYRALLHGLKQDPKSARVALLEVPARWRDFGYFYNLGLVCWALDSEDGRKEALHYWEEGRNALSGLGVRSLREKDILFSRLYHRLAVAFEASGDLDRAKDYSLLAKKLDDNNHSAYFLERRLSIDEELIHDETEKQGAD